MRTVSGDKNVELQATGVHLHYGVFVILYVHTVEMKNKHHCEQMWGGKKIL